MSGSQNQFHDENPSHKWRTEIPNIVEDFLTDPFEFRIYLHIKRRAGDGGNCTESSKKMAAACGMSLRKLREVKRSLEKPRPEFNNRPLIRTSHRKTESKDPDTDIITIVDVWDVNMEKFYKNKEKIGEAQGAGGVRHNVPEGTAPGAAKEEPFKEEHFKEEKSRNSVAPSEQAFGHASFFFEKIKENDPQCPKPKLDTWARDLDRMNKLDKRSWDQIKELIIFATEHDFWKSNILSPGKLRKQATSLLLQSKNASKLTKPEVDSKRFEESERIGRQFTSSKNLKLSQVRFEDTHAIVRIGNGWTPISYLEHGFLEQLQNALRKGGHI